MANDITYKRLADSLNNLKNYRGSEASRIREVLFGLTDPSFGPQPTFTPLNAGLNESQIDAIKMALSANDIALLHGPPGTGKTTTIVELILQFALLYNYRVLACAPSNIAVDNMVEKLAENIEREKQAKKLKILRLGHPARLLPNVLRHSLDVQIHKNEGTSIVEDIRKDMNKLLRDLAKTRNRGERQRLYGDLRTLRRELQEREEKVVDEIVKGSNIILATNVGSAERMLKNDTFDVVVIDEAAQGLESSCWIPILKGRKVVLAGDHCQLPPTVKSVEAEREGLSVTLFDRITKMYGDKVTRMLQIQYRMNELIMKWPSKELYHDKLLAAPSVQSHLLSDIPSIKKNSLTSIPIVMVDTAGCQLYEQKDTEGDSKSNEGEVAIVVAYVKELLDAGLTGNQIAVISPYNAQVSLLKGELSKIAPSIEIGSVDGFQGREKEAIIITFVRSNRNKEVGFLSENRRTNVAITRARRHLALIGDSETLSSNPFLHRMIQYVEEKGEVKSATEFLPADFVPQLVNDDIATGKSTTSSSSQAKSTKSQNKNKPSTKSETITNIPTKSDSSTKKSLTTNNNNSQQEATSKLSLKDVQENEEKRNEELRTQIGHLLISKTETTLAFPSSLTGSQRKFVHSVCEELGLNHESIGEGENRHIVVSKPSPVPSVPETTVNQTVASDHHKESKSEDKSIKPTTNLFSNLKIENVVEKKENPSKAVESAIPGTLPVVNESKKEEDDMKLLNDAINMKKECHFGHCTRPVQILGSLCEFCGWKYCMNHGMPEVHGCGDAAKKKARGTWLKDKKDPAPKPLKETERKLLQKKLQTKLDSSSSQRAAKNTKKKK